MLDFDDDVIYDLIRSAAESIGEAKHMWLRVHGAESERKIDERIDRELDEYVETIAHMSEQEYNEHMGEKLKEFMEESYKEFQEFQNARRERGNNKERIS